MMDDLRLAAKGYSVDTLLQQVPLFRALSRVDLARLIGALESVVFPADTLVFAENAEADALYLLAAGQVAVSIATANGERCIATLDAPAHFGDLGLLLARRTASVRTVTEVRAWRLPRRRFEQLVRDRPGIALATATSLAETIDRRSREHAGAPPAAGRAQARAAEAVLPPRAVARNAWGAGLAVAAAVLLSLWWFPPPAGLGVRGWHVTLILLGAAIAWLLEPVPEFVIALAMAVAWGLTGLAPLSAVFSGFVSSSYMVALGALGLAAAMARSGLLFRIALVLLRTFPRTYGGQVLALLVGGVAITPFMPIATARVAMITPVAQELANALGQAPLSPGSAGLAFAGILGYGSFGCIFLTGLVANFFILSLLPASAQSRVDWLGWFVNAAPAGLLFFAGTIAVLVLCFRPGRAAGMAMETLRHQKHVLGPLSRHEAITIAGLAVLFAGLLLQPFLRVDSAWLSLAALVFVVAGGALDRESFRGSVEWGYLVFFGVLLGAGGVLRGAGVDRWIGDALAPFARSVANPDVLVMLLSLGVVAARVVLPQIPAMYLLSLALVPAAPRFGLSPWVVGFVVQFAAYTWVHPRQSDYYRLTRGMTRGEMFTERHGIIVGIGLTIVMLAVIAVSVWYWRLIGLLTPWQV
jgi:di/tricarboxylate transporter